MGAIPDVTGGMVARAETCAREMKKLMGGPAESSAKTVPGRCRACNSRPRAVVTAEPDGICVSGPAARQEMYALAARPLEWATIAVGAISHLTAGQRLLFARRAIAGGKQTP